MMRNLLQKLAGYLLPAFLVLIALFIAWKNYIPGSYLIGWDSIHPEFNFSLNIGRMLSGVWREDQGLGAIAAHAHMSDLPRVILLWIASFAVPTALLRYLSIFSGLVLGPLGMYFFLKHALSEKLNKTIVSLASFLGGFFYLLNLTTLQQFTVPFEMFTVSYAAIPWLFYAAIRYLGKPKKKNILFFAFIALLSTPMAYASAQFFAFLACFVAFLGVLNLVNRFKYTKVSLVLLSAILMVNSFWLLPNIYSVVKQANVIENSKINLLFSPEAFLRNKDYGGELKNLVIDKNFLFSWSVFDFKQAKFVTLLSQWSEYLNTKIVNLIGYVLATCFGLGALISLIKGNKVGISLLAPAAIALFFLININPPTGNLYSFFYDNVALFREGFRMPFTKFSIPYLFVASFYFGYFFLAVFSVLKRKRILNIVTAIIFFTAIFGLYSFTKPVFEGKLISQAVETNLPGEYGQLFKWFEGKNGRIARLPLNTPWGWDYQSWGYQGSGFLNYGLDNPLLVRDFDRWSAGNETFYTQASFALYSNDGEKFEETLKKYQVRYLVLDESITNAGSTDTILHKDDIKNMLSGAKHVRQVAKFTFLTVYETDFADNSITAPLEYSSLNVNSTYSKKDPVYSIISNYIDKGSISYPFINFDNRADVSMREINSNLVIENKSQKIRITLPVVDKVIETFGQDRGFKEAYNCSLDKLGQVEKIKGVKGNTYKAFNSGVSCDYFYYPDLSYSQGYVLRVKGTNKEGRSLKVYLQNISSGRMDIEELLPEGDFDSYFVVLPKSLEGSGYTLNVETRSFGRVSSENEIGLIEFIPIPVDYLYSLKSSELDPVKVENKVSVDNVMKIGTWFYTADVKGSQGLVVLGQGYEDGWVAIKDGKVLNHFKFNSWANSWTVSGSGKVYIFFWPQMLEFAGFGLLISAFIFILTRRGK